VAYTTLIDTAALAGRIGAPNVAIVDCRYKVDDTGFGRRSYDEGHIPGAVFADVDHDLSGLKTGANGRHPLPEPSTFAETLGRFGIGNATQVFAYDQDAGMYASRLWWLLKWLGHDAVAVVDGGFAKWKREGRQISNATPAPAAASFVPHLRPEMAVDAADVARILTDRSWKLVDARAPERYRGDLEPIDRVPGHIPTAVNHFYNWNVGEDGAFLSADALREKLKASIGTTSLDHVVCYCGSGVTACQDLLALEHAGLTGAKLYPGSWSEWASDESRPIERGSENGPK
jgi:thiosulfate/3-mercaptopyruvate sulfurtransferase